ncbi:MAG: TlpA family protein disulfide reductase [Paramuribaculum sp.]|nr:TlpA family protein disulfide reductase [Paramuribaculum sp.]
MINNYLKFLLSRKIVTVLLLLPALCLAAKEKCKVIITASDGAKPYELVIKKKGADPKDSELRTKLESGIYECCIETDEIELESVVDFGEIEKRGITARTVDFYVENGATVKIHFDGNELTVESDGPEFLKQKRMKDAGKDWVNGRIAELGVEPWNLTEAQTEMLNREYSKWQSEYYKANPMLAFLLDIANQVSNFDITNHNLASLLDVYHQCYESLYPGHSAHTAIKAAESDNGLQILGHRYHDYTAYDSEGAEVNISDYVAGKPTLVICWATWCLSCRKDAKDIVPLYEKYRSRGLNAFSLAREFQSADNFKAAVAEDKNPWQCLLDLDDRFKIFNNHGVSSWGLLLIDADGNIVASGFERADIEPALKRLFPD